MRRAITGAFAAAVVIATVGAPAQATIRERFQIHEDYAYAEDCGFPVQVTGSRDDAFTIREGRNQDAGAFPVLNKVSYNERWTNPANGRWFTIRGRATFNEVKATRTAGSIFEFRAHESGQPMVVEDSDGKVVVRNSGSVHFTYLFDTLGDDEPGGDWVADLDLRVSGPHPSLFLHPCEYAVQLIG